MEDRPIRPSHRRIGAPSIDVDFSLAIHNRTGKYFIGRDVIALLRPEIEAIYYGSVAFDKPPTGLLGRVLGRLQHWQVMSRTSGNVLRLPAWRRSDAPLLHLDPFTVPTAPLRGYDAVLCHDVGPLTHPELFDPGICAAYRAIYAEIAEIGPHLVFVSKASEDAFADCFPSARPSSARVIYPALRVEMGGADEAAPPGLDRPFILTVGSIGARKNQARSIAAYARSGLAARGIDYVVCGGPEPGMEDVVALAARVEGVHLLPYVSDRALAWLYDNARGFVLASLLEGFGVPVAEAIARGLVPIVSRGGVLEEVAGPGALGVDPLDEAEIASAMVQLVEMSDAERSARVSELSISIERFDDEAFRLGWSPLPGDMLATRLQWTQ